jgi:D-xylose transport system substrate-binding protein
VILPDTESSVRWETADKPLLTAAFQEAGIEADIQNAQGDKGKMATIADSMISSGVNVLIITGLDSPSAAAIQAKAKAATSRRSTTTASPSAARPTTTSRSTTWPVGELQGEGLIKCLGDKKPPTSSSSTARRRTTTHAVQAGAVSKLKPKYDAATTSSSVTRPCRTGTTRRPVSSSSSC